MSPLKSRHSLEDAKKSSILTISLKLILFLNCSLLLGELFIRETSLDISVNVLSSFFLLFFYYLPHKLRGASFIPVYLRIPVTTQLSSAYQ